MKTKILLLISIFAMAISTEVLAQKKELRHVVMFKFKETSSAADVSKEGFDKLQKKLVASGMAVSSVEVPAGDTPTKYFIKGHGVEVNVTYVNYVLEVNVVKKPFFITLDHIEKGLHDEITGT